MALLSFVDSTPRAYRLKGSNAYLAFSTKTGASPRRIRACLKQAELAPVSVPAQITILLALTAGLFDLVPLDRMPDAEQAVRDAAKTIPSDIQKRFDIAKTLADEDRATIVETARMALMAFLPDPDAPAEPPQS